jgi:hypothetical protein
MNETNWLSLFLRNQPPPPVPQIIRRIQSFPSTSFRIITPNDLLVDCLLWLVTTIGKIAHSCIHFFMWSARKMERRFEIHPVSTMLMLFFSILWGSFVLSVGKIACNEALVKGWKEWESILSSGKSLFFFLLASWTVSFVAVSWFRNQRNELQKLRSDDADRLQGLQAKIANLERELHLKQTRIADLEKEVADLKGEMSVQLYRVELLQLEVETLKRELNNEEEELSRLRHALQLAEEREKLWSRFISPLSISEKEEFVNKILKSREIIEKLCDLKVMPLDQLSLTSDIIDFDLDSAMEVLEGSAYDNTEQLFFNLFNIINNNRVAIPNLVVSYRNPNISDHAKEAKKIINKILTYLIIKARALLSDWKEDLRSHFSSFVYGIIHSIIDAHQNCVDQVLSQLEDLILKVLEDLYSGSDCEKRVQNIAKLSLYRYKLKLIDTILVETYPNEAHMADLAREVKKRIVGRVNASTSTFMTRGARFANLVDDVNARAIVVEDKFWKRFQPVVYLLEGTASYHGACRKLFNEMCSWFRERIFSLTDLFGEETVSLSSLKEAIGSDFEMNFEVTPEAVRYFFLEHNILQVCR